MYRIIYAMYAGDNFLAEGTANQLAERFGVQSKTIKYMATPVYYRRLAARKKPIGRAKYTVKIEE